MWGLPKPYDLLRSLGTITINLLQLKDLVLISFLL